MMRVVFAGPTVEAVAVRDRLDSAQVLPPARAGDVYRACRDGATAIGLIDGFFDGVPAVWHKEILWALEQGIQVFGASSMGALRAAELHTFGMIGVGRVFEAYRDGTLEDDDDVALRHGPAELGYVPLSEPMVNIRATLDHAVSSGILEAKVAHDLSARAKAVYFPERSWDRMLAGLTDVALGMAKADLRDWIKANAVDQKRLDALAMLEAMADRTGPARTAIPAPFEFQHTAMWRALTRAVDAAPPDRETQLILDHLRQDSERYQALRRRAVRAMDTTELPDVMEADVNRALTRFRTEHRLYTAQALEAWLAAQDMDLIALKDRIAGDLQLTGIIDRDRLAFRAALLGLLKAEGAYDAVATHARRAAACLDRIGVAQPTLDDLDIHGAQLLIWYFEHLCGHSVPDDLDAFLAQNDIATRSEFEQIMARAYLLWQNEG